MKSAAPVMISGATDALGATVPKLNSNLPAAAAAKGQPRGGRSGVGGRGVCMGAGVGKGVRRLVKFTVNRDRPVNLRKFTVHLRKPIP